jgi:hypothetical protein
MVTTSMPLAEVARAFAEAERLDGLKTVIRFDDDT